MDAPSGAPMIEAVMSADQPSWSRRYSEARVSARPGSRITSPVSLRWEISMAVDAPGIDDETDESGEHQSQADPPDRDRAALLPASSFYTT